MTRWLILNTLRVAKLLLGFYGGKGERVLQRFMYSHRTLWLLMLLTHAESNMQRELTCSCNFRQVSKMTRTFGAGKRPGKGAAPTRWRKQATTST